MIHRVGAALTYATFVAEYYFIGSVRIILLAFDADNVGSGLIHCNTHTHTHIHTHTHTA